LARHSILARHYSPCHSDRDPRHLPSFPTRRSSNLRVSRARFTFSGADSPGQVRYRPDRCGYRKSPYVDDQSAIFSNVYLTYTGRSEEHTSELQSRFDLVCRLLLDKKKLKLKTSRYQ